MKLVSEAKKAYVTKKDRLKAQKLLKDLSKHKKWQEKRQNSLQSNRDILSKCVFWIRAAVSIVL